MTRKTLISTLHAFRELVTVAKVDSVMCAYNRINDRPGTSAPTAAGRVTVAGNTSLPE